MFFSVRRNLKINGKVYLPCVCYYLPKHLEATVEKLTAEGKAVIHEDSVGFMNGKLLNKSKKVKAKKQHKEVTKEEDIETF